MRRLIIIKKFFALLFLNEIKTNFLIKMTPKWLNEDYGS
jgi:hypothetical protein